MIQMGSGTGFVTVSSPPTGVSRVLVGLLAAAAIGLVAAVAVAFDRRSSRRLAVAEGPAGSAQVCDDVVCEFHPAVHPAVPEVEERKAA